MSDQQSLAKRSPRSRKSLSSGGVTFGGTAGEQENRTDGMGGGGFKSKGKGRSASIGGAELMGASSLKVKLTPKKTARRALAPRKSILKQYNQDDTQTYNYTNMDGQGQDDEDNDTQYIGGGTESTTMRFRRRVSFAAHAHVRMFEIDPVANQLSQSQSSVSSQQQQQAPAPLPLATATSNIFGAPNEPVVPTTSRRRSSAGGAGGGGHSRRASVQGVEAFTKPSAAPAAVGFVPTSSNSRRSSAVSEGSVDMDLESDEEEEEGQQNGEGQFNSFQLDGPPASAPFEGNNPSSSSSGAPFTFGIPNPPTIIVQQDEDEQSEEEDGDMSLDGMDETQVHGGIISAQPSIPSNKRQSLTHPTSPSASTEDGDSDEDDDGGLDSLDPDDKTMDFTVATGGIIPTSAPATAAKNVRASLGYAIEEEEAERMAAWSKSAASAGGAPVLGSAAARRAAAAAEEEMRWDGDGEEGGGGEDSGSEMDFTRVIGGIIERSDEGAGEEDMDEGSTMDMTRVMGGIISSRSAEEEEGEEEDSDEGGEMDMDETVAVGGLIMQRREEDNTTRRSIFDRDDDDEEDNMDEAGGMDFTVARGGIFASSNDVVPAPAPAPPAQPSLFGRSSLNLSSKSPAKSPRKSLGAYVPPTPTRPLESSLSRPTASSAAKVKPAPTPRSIFDSPAKPLAPIPSKGKPSANTPGSARKLVFSAVASPAASARKRGVEEMEAGGGEGSSIFSIKSPKRRSSVRGGEGAAAVEEDVFGSVAGSGGGNGKGKERESPILSSAPSSNIFGSYQVEANIFTAPELPPSPKKTSAAPSTAAAPSSPARNIFTKATSPSPIKGPATIFDIPSSASNSFEQAATSATSIFSTSPRVAPTPPTTTAAPAARPRSSLAFAEPSVPSSSSASSSFVVEQAVPVALASRATPKKKLGRPSLGAESSRREREMDVEMMVDEAHQAAPVSLGQFLDMTGLTFMDKMHPRRRSTIGPGEMLGIHRNNNDTTRSIPGREYQTIEYANYVLSFPYLAIYQWACSHLKESTIQSQQTVQNLDHDASEVNPVLFREYLEAEDDEKGMIEAQLKYLKVYSHLLIKRRWREWRLDLIVKLKATHEADLADLQEDQAKIQELSSAFEQQTPLSTLRTRHEALRLQLEQERQKVAEVLACDQNELSHRRSDIKEQNDQIDSLKADLADQNVMLNSLTTKFNGLDLQRQAAQDAIDHAAGIWADTQGFTREKVFRLKEEFDTLEHLHSVKITSVRSDTLEMVFDGALKLVLASEKFQPVVSGARVEFVRAAKPRRNEVVLTHLFELVKVFVEQMQAGSVPELVQTVSHMWSSASRIATEFHLISLRYPVTYSPSSTSNSLQTTVPILLPPVKARILVSFDITAKSILQWPGKIGDLGLGVKVAYGKVDSIVLLDSVRTRLEQATPESHFGTLVNSCLEAVERYK
ncbi:Spc7 kinetochore protein-domain-containing protein [Mrakia frigida]|uniref:Spc7 kinetochore protein-domain-containing protein n=1 Tax=Mrakia frigida TaxID=29902 RepID=UPI003FCBF5D2